MTRVPYSQVFDEVATLLGWLPNDVSRTDAAAINTMINRRVRWAWEFYWWPELMDASRRLFAAEFDPLGVEDEWEQGDIRFFQGVYYQNLVADNAIAPPGSGWIPAERRYTAEYYDAGKTYVAGDRYRIGANYYQWHAGAGVLLVPLRPILSTTDSRYTPIGHVRAVWDRDPIENPDSKIELRFTNAPTGVLVMDSNAEAWLEQRPYVPSFRGEIWSATGEYATGQQVYYSGDFYRAIADTEDLTPPATTHDSPAEDIEFWERIDFPFIFAEYCAQGAYADMMGKAKGQNEKYPNETEEAFQILAKQMLRLKEREREEFTR